MRHWGLKIASEKSRSINGHGVKNHMTTLMCDFFQKGISFGCWLLCLKAAPFMNKDNELLMTFEKNNVCYRIFQPVIKKEIQFE